MIGYLNSLQTDAEHEHAPGEEPPPLTADNPHVARAHQLMREQGGKP